MSTTLQQIAINTASLMTMALFMNLMIFSIPGKQPNEKVEKLSTPFLISFGYSRSQSIFIKSLPSKIPYLLGKIPFSNGIIVIINR